MNLRRLLRLGREWHRREAQQGENGCEDSARGDRAESWAHCARHHAASGLCWLSPAGFFRPPSILRNLICPLTTRLKSRISAASSLVYREDVRDTNGPRITESHIFPVPKRLIPKAGPLVVSWPATDRTRNHIEICPMERLGADA